MIAAVRRFCSRTCRGFGIDNGSNSRKKSQSVKVFISHSWGTDRWEYEQIVFALHAIFGPSWQNLSIAEEAAMPFDREHLFSTRWKAREQRLIEQSCKLKERSYALEERLTNLAGPLENLEIKLDPTPYVEAERRSFQEKVKQLEEIGIGVDRLVQIEKSESDARITNLLARKETNYERLIDLRHQLLVLSREKVDIQVQLASIEAELTPINVELGKIDKVRDISLDVWGVVKLGLRLKIPNENLADALLDRIAEADVFSLIGSMYAQYGKWMDFELELASRIAIPIIVVLPRNQYLIPRELDFRGFRMLHWEELHSIGEVLATISKRT
jgi:hypothetical protein